MRLIRLLTLFFVVLSCQSLLAQDDYRSEIGVLGGSAFCLGDANSNLFVGNDFAYGIIYRHKLDTRLAISAQWNSTNVKSKLLLTDFSNPVNAFDFSAEFNFFDYENKVYRPNSKKHTLYMFAGLGAAIFNYEGAGAFGMSIPAGLGYKIMLGKRLNLNFIWTQRLFLSDKLEGLALFNDVNGLNGSNIYNNDWLTSVSVGLTLNIWKKECNCMKLKY